MTAAAEIDAWTIAAGIKGIGQVELIEGYCERLLAAGVPLWRASIGTDTLHPLIHAQGHRWHAGRGVEAEFYSRLNRDAVETDWLRSPWSWMVEHRCWTLRQRLSKGEGTAEFGLLADIAAAGGTDYWAHIIELTDEAETGEERGLATSWTTRTPEGFTDDHLALIEATLPAFALAFKTMMAVGTAHTLLATYLGQDAARRVLRGEIERGQATTVRTVLWFSDLTGFTRAADSLPRERLLELLNVYLDGLAGVVQAHGGEVLKFMGDGILAVLPGAPDEACRHALDAAEEARALIAGLNRERAAAGLPVSEFTVALHEGEVYYGNVGSRERLDFTVVGPAVNEVCRIEELSRSLDQRVLVSAQFAAACGTARDRLVSVGRYALRGVGRPQELFTLDSPPS